LPYFLSEGMRIHYNVEGKGIPFVIPSYDYEGRREGLGLTDDLIKAGYQVIGFDFRGSGQSQPATDPSQLRAGYAVRDCVALLDSLGVKEKAYFMGYSQGSGHSLCMALTHPERVRGLVLGGTGVGALSMAGLFFKSALLTRQRLVPWGENLTRNAKSVGEKQVKYWETYVEALQQDALEYGNLEAVTVPTIILVGDGDSTTDSAAFYVTQMLEKRLPNAWRIVIEGTNHMTCAADPRFKEAVLAFLKQQSGRKTHQGGKRNGSCS